VVRSFGNQEEISIEVPHVLIVSKPCAPFIESRREKSGKIFGMTEYGREASQKNSGGPCVSVVMGTFNGAKYLASAIDSLLGQTFPDFELILIDDCSTDHTPEILRGITDARIRVVRNEHNLGIPDTLNKGIGLAIGKYVAFQDHDDLSLPDRLKAQTDFLNRYPDVAMVGSSCRIVDASGELVRQVFAKCDDAELRWALLWWNPFFQTTLMVRRNVLVEIGGYSSDPMYQRSEDYEMMSRVGMRYRVANLPQLLGCWREHADSTSAPESEGRRLLESRKNISLRNVRDAWRRGDQISEEVTAYMYDGMWFFQFGMNGEEYRGTPDQIGCAPQHLRRLECVFSSTTPNSQQTPRIRAARYYRWGRHGAVLACRGNWSLKTRAKLAVNAVRLLWYGLRLYCSGFVNRSDHLMTR
jgi:glycosyltransferase involved in cell wall biosynthesis